MHCLFVRKESVLRLFCLLADTFLCLITFANYLNEAHVCLSVCLPASTSGDGCSFPRKGVMEMGTILRSTPSRPMATESTNIAEARHTNTQTSFNCFPSVRSSSPFHVCPMVESVQSRPDETERKGSGGARRSRIDWSRREGRNAGGASRVTPLPPRYGP